MKRYRIVVRGEFGELTSIAFSEFSIETGHGKTVLTADVEHRAAIHGILDRLRDFAIEVESVREVGESGEVDSPGIR
jgi:hypothetical protein